jgi:hypothetical protein
MSAPKHTPGPWRLGALQSYDGYTGQPFRNVWAGQGDAATVTARAMRSEGAMTNDVDADARLIAAAPEMLEALNELLPRIENFEDRGPYGEGWQSKELEAAINAVRAAIAKATGSAS